MEIVVFLEKMGSEPGNGNPMPPINKVRTHVTHGPWRVPDRTLFLGGIALPALPPGTIRIRGCARLRESVLLFVVAPKAWGREPLVGERRVRAPPATTGLARTRPAHSIDFPARDNKREFASAK